MAALVFGNAKYLHGGVLKNPANDASDMAAKMSSYGFHTIVAADASLKDMEKKLKEFKELLKTNEVGLFFFAGHGMQIDAKNYLLAVDTDTSGEIEAKHSSLSLDLVIEIMQKSSADTKIIMLDACRNNPWERSWSRTGASRGLASVYAPKGTIIGFATSPGELASDGRGRNGTYTAALLQHIDQPDLFIETMFKQVRNTVAAETGGKQTTWEHTSLSGNFFFNSSLGKRVITYPETSLADNLFIIEETKPSHKIIQGLKSHDWYGQNAALEHLTAASAGKMLEANLFVVGRNIYQAACGNARDAISFINSFVKRTAKYPEEKRKAILDGMLFEVFFDKDAKLRTEIKGNLFNELFELQKRPELKESFDFIANALDAPGNQFYVLPGSGHQLAVTLNTMKIKDVHRIITVYLNGNNVLHAVDEEWAENDPAKRRYRSRTSAELVDVLSRELLVPVRLLKVSYVPPGVEHESLAFPIGYTVRKP